MTHRTFGGTAAALALLVAAALSAVPARAEFPFPNDAEINAACTGLTAPRPCCTGPGTGTCTRCNSSGLPVGCVALVNEMSGGAGSCNGEKWKYASTNFCTTDPAVNASANELFGVSGMSIEIAWRTETGRSDVVIAVHDSGIEWDDGGANSDLRKKFYLNCGELPAPRNAGGMTVPGSSPGC